MQLEHQHSYAQSKLWICCKDIAVKRNALSNGNSISEQLSLYRSNKSDLETVESELHKLNTAFNPGRIGSIGSTAPDIEKDLSRIVKKSDSSKFGRAVSLYF